jgi:glycosyltransferase involved in cell wall biosynthesis
MRFGFVSTMGGLPWGGSEELWSRAAMELLRRGHEVAFNCPRWPTVPPPIQRLTELGAKPHFRSRMRIGRSLRRTLETLRLVRLKFLGWVQKTRPDFVFISFSCHGDDPQIANTCRALGVRYAVVLQAAGAHNWIPARSLEEYRSAYAHAERCFFVSDENRELLESNLAIKLPRCEIADNPFTVSVDAAPAWPSSSDCWKLACVARIHFLSKSQDLLVRVLRLPKWRARPLKVSLWGTDQGFLSQLRGLIDLHGLQQHLVYRGCTDDIESMWSEHHALLLPSRMEGNALSLIEAMLCGRVPITTNVGRAAELIDDNDSGFIAPAATAELIDEVLERAWQRRNEWQAMGRRAAQAIRARHSLRPAEDLANRLLELASPSKTARRLAA